MPHTPSFQGSHLLSDSEVAQAHTAPTPTRPQSCLHTALRLHIMGLQGNSGNLHCTEAWERQTWQLQTQSPH